MNSDGIQEVDDEDKTYEFIALENFLEDENLAIKKAVSEKSTSMEAFDALLKNDIQEFMTNITYVELQDYKSPKIHPLHRRRSRSIEDAPVS